MTTDSAEMLKEEGLIIKWQKDNIHNLSKRKLMKIKRLISNDNSSESCRIP